MKFGGVASYFGWLFVRFSGASKYSYFGEGHDLFHAHCGRGGKYENWYEENGRFWKLFDLKGDRVGRMDSDREHCMR